MAQKCKVDDAIGPPATVPTLLHPHGPTNVLCDGTGCIHIITQTLLFSSAAIFIDYYLPDEETLEAGKVLLTDDLDTENKTCWFLHARKGGWIKTKPVNNDQIQYVYNAVTPLPSRVMFSFLIFFFPHPGTFLLCVLFLSLTVVVVPGAHAFHSLTSPFSSPKQRKSKISVPPGLWNSSL